MMKISSFSGMYRFLSNFYPSPIESDGLIFPTAEHLFQGAKCLNQIETSMFTVNGKMSPGEAKRAGRKVTLRPNWDQIKIQVMEIVIKAKFDQNQPLRMSLLATWDKELIEGNTWGDTFWGVCNGIGENNLGKILMAYRETLNPRG